MVKYGIFRGENIVGREIFSDLKMAIKERDEWNKQFEEFNFKVKTDPKFKSGKLITPVEVREFKRKKMSAEEKLRRIFE